MKNILISFLTLVISVNTYAQKPDKEKMKALKVAHITEQLDLTQKEAQIFWPIYNNNEAAKNKLKKDSGIAHIENVDALTEADAKIYLNKVTKMDFARQKLQDDYYNKLSTALSSKKTLKLMEADRSFRKKMIKEFKERHCVKKQK